MDNGYLLSFLHQLKIWALFIRKPLLWLVWNQLPFTKQLFPPKMYSDGVNRQKFSNSPLLESVIKINDLVSHKSLILSSI